MAQFRKKPVVIEAERFDDEFITKYFGTAHRTGLYFDHRDDRWTLTIRTLEGDMRAEMGDWIITGIKGERYPCKPDIFAETYAPVEEVVSHGVDR